MKKIKVKHMRLGIQITFLFIVIIAASSSYLQSKGIVFPWVSESTFHYIGPICGVTSIYQFLTSSTLWVVKIKSVLGIVIGLSLMLSVLFGPVICGFICPFGTLQDLGAKIGRKIFKDKYNTFIPKRLNNKLKYLRYVTFILTIILTATSSIALLEMINPYHGFLGIFNRRISMVALAMFTLIMSLSLFIHRPWCRYLCPYGAYLGLFNKIKVFRILRKKSTCVGCKKCSKNCPVGIDVHDKEEVRDLNCISCLECVNRAVCPKKDTLLITSKDEIEQKISEDIKEK